MSNPFPAALNAVRRLPASELSTIRSEATSTAPFAATFHGDVVANGRPAASSGDPEDGDDGLCAGLPEGPIAISLAAVASTVFDPSEMRPRASTARTPYV